MERKIQISNVLTGHFDHLIIFAKHPLNYSWARGLGGSGSGRILKECLEKRAAQERTSGAEWDSGEGCSKTDVISKRLDRTQEPDRRQANFQNWKIHGLYWGSYKIHQPNVLRDSLKELLAWLSRGLITVNISHTFSLTEVRSYGLYYLSNP
uniref:Uncharacterized protein n=1 Tax=Solanum lycopersicum TaxID=4081 RepID=A0A3Q7GBC6_SOLLC